MKVAFVTTQSANGSSVVGRILPLAQELARDLEVHVLVHQGELPIASNSQLHWHTTGRDPFTIINGIKKRLTGIRLIGLQLSNSFKVCRVLSAINPERIVLVKTLPENTLGLWLYTRLGRNHKIILDCDDFELTANQVNSLVARAAIHWAQRVAGLLSHQVVVATPFLQDYWQQLLGVAKPITLIPTGLASEYYQSSQTNNPPVSPCILYAGSVSISSGHRVDLLPQILAAVRHAQPAVKLIVAGSGHDVEEIKATVARLGLADAVEWLGRFDQQSLLVCLKRRPIIIDPIDGGITNRAKSSFRVLLAAANGLPIVTSNIGIRPQLIPRSLHAQFFAAPAQASEYASKIIALFDHALSLDQIKLLREHSKQYNWSQLTDAYKAIL